MDLTLGNQAGYLAAFIVGLLGGVHCVGMCGGIVGALTFGLPEPVRSRPRGLFPYLLAYNLARILSYTLAGTLMGGVGWFAAHWLSIRDAQLWLHGFAALFMIALGLYLGGWWRGLARLEQAGGRLWKRLEPLGRRFIPVRSPWAAFQLGLVWGWLPCGLVYSVLIWSIAAGSAVHGALLLLSFGLGTLPNLLAMGVFAAQLAHFTRRPLVRQIAGLMVLSFGVFALWGIAHSL
ncbi:MAG: sulfite exporter TauE/SafE family protein [Gammaproteobacteria bacterium]